ncbi:MAG: cytidine deaminase [Candidatus Marinimicrobia bacterium]|jgi:cytidine deaminase|nr:cytidine deaminase [Candidatus Neomarinimicrobiota bacterium]|tara:strand:- start:1012 stop:1398 length:387 start_codon:yes stop_codon:yes gene_type:complete
MNQEKLIRIAKKMREKSYAPFSKYTVGASVETEDGTIIGGCNVESVSYGLTCCAERIALYNAVSEGHSTFKALAVASKNGGFPCGACRQVIWELCGDIPILITDNENKMKETSSRTLLPDAFDKEKLI